MVDGSASKPALRQDTDYMVEKTYLHIAPYLWAFEAGKSLELPYGVGIVGKVGNELGRTQ